MTRKNLKKDWCVGDVLIKNGHRIIIHEIEENNIKYLNKWLVCHSKDCFPKDIKLKDKWKKIDSIKPYNISNVKKSIYHNPVKGII